jgi:hypothetical protein
VSNKLQYFNKVVLDSGVLPVVGGNTNVTLTSAATLASLNVSATPLGTATIDTSGSDPIATFPITGGTEGPDSSIVLLHQDSGLELADSAGTVDLQDFRIDTQNRVVDANVTVNDTSAGNVAVFGIGSDGTSLTLTPAAATVVDQALGTTAITPDVVIGTASPSPETIDNPLCQAGLRFLHDSGAIPILGGTTAVFLTSAGTLQSLGVSVTPDGTASVFGQGPYPIATFPITGGTLGSDGSLTLLHQGSGLTLSDSAGSVSLNDFLIDTKNGLIDANVAVNGTSAGNVAVFNLGGPGGTLTLTPAAADVVDKALGTTAITSSTTIGTAIPFPLPA